MARRACEDPLPSTTYDRSVFLTFDDGPEPSVTPRLLDVLRAERVKATFFIVGSKAIRPFGQEILYRASEDGHSIGNHTFSHLDLTRCPDTVVREEVTATHEIIQPFESENRLFRPPYGAINSRIAGIVTELGYRLALWDNDPRDWLASSQPTGWVESALVAARKRGARVIVCHDTHPSTVDGLSLLVRGLREDGYTFSTLGTPQVPPGSTRRVLAGSTPTASDCHRR